MPNPSQEQQRIVNAVIDGKNVVVDAVAGSGKTTTVLAIAAALPNKQIVQITFNSQLKSEVRAKVVIEGIGNVQVHTYHSVATSYYDRSAYTDAKIMAILEQKQSIHKKLTVDILIIDEAQDMTLLYFKLINKFINDVGGVGQLVILGDRYQGVYEFMKADTRFLTHASDIWPSREFVYLTLQESYRVTKPIAWFINNVMLGQTRIISKNESKVPVEWYICNPFKDLESLFLRGLIKQIKQGTIRPDDIFVLAASLKSGVSPTRYIENILVNNKIPVCVPISDEGRLDDDVTRGKVVFATFPSSKGRERPIVIITGFDQWYFDFYAKNVARDACPSTLYVAATRAKKRLILVGDENSKGLSFLNSQVIGTPPFNQNVTYMNENLLLTKDPPAVPKATVEKKTSVMDLVKFLPQEAIEYLSPILASLFQTRNEPMNPPISITCKVRTTNNMYEDVSHLNGLAIPAIWETQHGHDEQDQNKASSGNIDKSNKINCNNRNIATMMKRIQDPKIFKNRVRASDFIKNAIRKIPRPIVHVADFLYMSNVYWTLSEGYHGQLAQIQTYDWLDGDAVKQCIDLLETHVGSNSKCQFEVDTGITIQTVHGTVMISGTMDIVSPHTIWEVKCTESFQLEHMLQLVVYYWLYSKQPENDPDTKFKLINIRSGEIKELDTNPDIACHVQNMIDCLLSYKYKTAEKSHDTDFIQECHKAIQKVC